jgi:16S rRNA (cytosine1402-N4)-methyltransferase
MVALRGGIGVPHRSVLLNEAIQLLRPERGGAFLDATLGLGGHSEAILEASDEATVIGIDLDRNAIKLAQERLVRFGSRFRAFHANFKEVMEVVQTAQVSKLRGILADLGVSSLQLESPERGFSFRHESPLDMRMNPDSDDVETAAELLLRLSEEEIARIIFEYGEEKRSRRIARWIVERREKGKPIQTTKELAGLVERAVRSSSKDKIHPATRTFQALRIAVNRELEGLAEFIENAVELLEEDGRLVVISFHSLEDRIVKRVFNRLAGKCECPPRFPVCACGARRIVEILTRRPLTPSQDEIDENPRARSARLRACRRLELQ